MRDLLGEDTHPASVFPPENRSTAFENNARDHRASSELTGAYRDAAEGVASRAVTRIDTLLPCDPGDGATCGHTFVERFLGRAFRRPASADELASFRRLFDEVHAQDGFSDAVAVVIEAALQSPQFLYRLEAVPEDARPGDVVEVTGYDMASRLSYFLTASMPDEELFAAAAEGRLSTADEVAAQARRLLEGERGRRAVAQFHRQWLGLDGLGSISKDTELHPELAGLDQAWLGAQWQQSLEAFAEHVFFDEGTVDALFHSELAFLSPELATLYGLESRDPETGAYILDGERAGLLTQPGLMALLALPDQSSPIARGVFVREYLLCRHLPPPPADIDIEGLELAADLNTRERVAALTADPACASCHSVINPVGFGFEHYDAIGRWRDEENGRPIDASGYLGGVNDLSVEGEFMGAVELSDKIAASSDFQHCFVEKWSTFALGRQLTAADLCTVERVAEVLRESGGDLREMLVVIATSDAFRHRVVDGGR